MATGEGTNTGNTTPTASFGEGSDTAPSTSQEKGPEQVAAPSDTPKTSSAPAAKNPLPEHVPYVLIGAGTASFACMKAIRERDPNAKVFMSFY